MGGSAVPIASVALLLFAAALTFLMHGTTFGKAVFAIGGNRQAARYSGIAVTRTRILLFAMAGTSSAVAAIFYLGNFNTARADMAFDHGLRPRPLDLKEEAPISKEPQASSITAGHESTQ